MNIETIAKIVGIVSSGIAILTAIVGVVVWAWKKSRFSQKLSRKLEIVKSSVVQDPINSVCTLDVTLKNNGSQDILITRLELEVVDIGRDFAKGPLLASEDYTIDISDLEQVDDVGQVDLSQVIEAGKHDRFTVTLAANYIGMGVFTAWRLKPTFFSKDGRIQGDIFEVWLPEPSGISFEEARKTENIEEEMVLKSIVQSALKEDNAVEASVRQEVETLMKAAEKRLSERDTRGWRREMAVIVNKLGQEEKLGAVLHRKLFPTVDGDQRKKEAHREQSSGDSQEISSRGGSEEGDKSDGDHPDPEKSDKFEQLINEPDFAIFTNIFHELYFDLEQREQLRKFIRSEEFCQNVQGRMRKAVGVKDMADCYEYIFMADKHAAKDIFVINGFGSRVIPHKLNEEQDIENISLCLEIIGNCDRHLAGHIIDGQEFNKKLFIKKINGEEDLWRIGHAIERLSRIDTYFAKEIVESEYLDIENLVNQLKREKDAEKIEMCISGFQYASKEMAKQIMVEMDYPADDLIEEKSLLTAHTSQPEKIVEVATPKDLLDAIGSDRIIVLSSFRYQLDSLEGDSSNQHVSWDYGELIIDDVHNLCIVSERRVLPYLGVLPQLLASLEHVNVLTFNNSTAVTLSNLEVGHIPEGYCTGGVLNYTHCNHMRIVDSTLFGCGTEGIRLESCNDVKIENSEIRNCNDSIFSIYDSRSVKFIESRFRRNTGCDLINVSDSSDILIDRCKIENNGAAEDIILDYALFNIAKGESVLVHDSRITGNSAGFFMKQEGTVALENSIIEKNNFREDHKTPK
jgi:hypothetical protein